MYNQATSYLGIRTLRNIIYEVTTQVNQNRFSMKWELTTLLSVSKISFECRNKHWPQERE